MRTLLLLTIFLYGHCLDLPRGYQSTRENICRLEEFSNHWELTTNLGHQYYIESKDEREELSTLFKGWDLGSFIEVWSSKQFHSKTVALHHETSGSCVFAKSDGPFFGKDSKIKCYQLIGERCSGTNFCSRIMQNFRDLPVKFEYGWKHFPIWFEHDISGEWKEDTSTLFLVIVRNPYAWLASLNRTPHHSANEFKKISLSKFIRMPWRLDPDVKELQKFDLDPLTGNLFQNVMAMRTAKLRDWLYLQEAPNAFFINYETLRDHPYAVLAEMADLFDLDLKSVFSPALFYKNQKGRIYQKPASDMPRLSDMDRVHINRCLSPSIEMEYGYFLH